jgi:2-dehydropantoate 2-reductase
MEAGMKIAVVGGGAMGSLFAARLAVAGFATTLVEVDAGRLEHICKAGVVVDLAGRCIVAPVPCVQPADLERGQELLILFTKFAGLSAALAQSRHAMAPEGVVAVLSNGLGVAGQLEGLIPENRLVLGVSDVAADLRADGVHSDGTGLVKIGMANPADDPAPLARVQSVLETAGFSAHAMPDIRQAIWEKLAFNAAFNAVATLADARVCDLDNVPGRRIVAAILAEVGSVARAGQVPFDHAAVSARIEQAFCGRASIARPWRRTAAPGVAPKSGPSMVRLPRAAKSGGAGADQPDAYRSGVPDGVEPVPRCRRGGAA